jgi:hypothetical protein
MHQFGGIVTKHLPGRHDQSSHGRRRFQIGTPLDTIEAAAVDLSNQNPGKYVVVVNDFGAHLVVRNRLSADTPAASALGHYWLNGKKKSFTARQKERAHEDAEGSGGDGAAQIERERRASRKSKQMASADKPLGMATRLKSEGRIWTKTGADKWYSPVFDEDYEVISEDYRTNDEMDVARGYVAKAAMCSVCGRKLTSRESIALGFGPSHSRAQIKVALAKPNIPAPVRERMLQRISGGSAGRVKPVRRERSKNKQTVYELNESEFKSIPQDVVRTRAGKRITNRGQTAAAYALAVGGVNGAMAGFRHHSSLAAGATNPANPILKQMVDNLRALQEVAERKERENGFISRTRKWYDGAHDVAIDIATGSKKEDFDEDGAAGVLAVLSASMDWDNNVFLAREVVRIIDDNPEVTEDDLAQLKSLVKKLNWDEKKKKPKSPKARGYVTVDPPDADTKLVNVKDPQTRALLLRVISVRQHGGEPRSPYLRIDEDGKIVEDTARGTQKTRYQSGENLAKAIAIYLDPTPETLDTQLGSGVKVRSFYNNIAYPDAPEGDVTIDTHAASALVGAPYAANTEPFKTITEKSSAEDGPYVKLLMIEAFRIVAAENPQYYAHPREAQSVLWELWREAAEANDAVSKRRKAELRQAWAAVDVPGVDVEWMTEQARSLMIDFVAGPVQGPMRDDAQFRDGPLVNREEFTLGQAR